MPVRFEYNVAKFYIVEVLTALEHLHHMNIIYRDLKPENVLLNEHGHVVVVDFGFAKLVKDRTFTVCGTVEFLAPEIIENKGYGKSADYWALGVLLYEMIVGHPPFHAETSMGTYEKILHGNIRDKRYWTALRGDKSKQYLSCRDLIQDLLKRDRMRRLGGVKGVAGIKKHPWFHAVDWGAVYFGQIEPPFRPEVKSLNDTQFFDDYPESEEDYAVYLQGKEQTAFATFDGM